MSARGRSVREIATRIVYWGPRGSGKTESLRAVSEQLDPEKCSQFLNPSDSSGHTLFMDLLTVEMGALDGVPLRLHLVTLPGDSRLNEDRLLTLRGADGFVFVADSRPGRQDENREALESLRTHLSAIGQPDCPIVIQCNHRDAPGAIPAERMAVELGLDPTRHQWFETNAAEGTGVIEALTAVAARVIGVLSSSAEERTAT